MSFCRIWYKLAVVFCNKVFLLTKPEVATTADYQKQISLSLVPPSYAMPKVPQFFDFRGSLYVTVPLTQGKLQDSLEFFTWNYGPVNKTFFETLYLRDLRTWKKKHLWVVLYCCPWVTKPRSFNFFLLSIHLFSFLSRFIFYNYFTYVLLSCIIISVSFTRKIWWKRHIFVRGKTIIFHEFHNCEPATWTFWCFNKFLFCHKLNRA